MLNDHKYNKQNNQLNLFTDIDQLKNPHIDY